MIYALFTAICWSFGGFSSSRLARIFGAAIGNFIRLGLATAVLLLICILNGASLTFPGQKWFILAGVLHLTLGDLGLYAVYRRLGPRIGVLMVASLSPGVALLGEWILLGTSLKPLKLGIIGGILFLVILAVAPRERKHLSRRELQIGIAAGLFATVMQGLSAVVTRYAYTLSEDPVSPWSAAFSRVTAGVLGVFCWLLILHFTGKKPFRKRLESLPEKRFAGHPALWMTVSVLMGPVLGLTFLMKAFETTPSGLVQAIIATLPVFMIPVAWLLDGSIPSRRSVICGCAAVALTCWLMYS